MTISRGDIYMARLSENNGSIQGGMRPILIISNDKCNEHSPVVTIVPFTSKLRKNPLPTHVLIKSCGLKKPSLALTEQIMSFKKIELGEWLGNIGKEYQLKVDQAIKIQLSIQ